MPNTLIYLFYEYFKTGIFALGGGYATIPFLFDIAQKYPWFSENDLVDMIAVSNITPGPIGINMATYSGFTAYSVLGSVVSTGAIILGPFIITLIAVYFIEKFKNSSLLKSVFDGLKPASCALLVYVLYKLVLQNFFFDEFQIDFKAVILCLILFLIYPKVKSYPSLIIIIGGIMGILFNLF